MKSASAKPYIVAAGIIVAAITLLGIVVIKAAQYQKQERDQFMAGVNRRLAAEKARWNNLTPEQQKAETEAREARAKVAAEGIRRERFLDSAKGACLLAIKNALNDPYSAKFDPINSWWISNEKDGVVLVQPKLRAKNSFGAYVYSTMNCRVRDEGDGVRVIELKAI